LSHSEGETGIQEVAHRATAAYVGVAWAAEEEMACGGGAGARKA